MPGVATPDKCNGKEIPKSWQNKGKTDAISLNKAKLRRDLGFAENPNKFFLNGGKDEKNIC